MINGVRGDVNNLNNEDGIYSECIENGHFAMTFGKLLGINFAIWNADKIV